MRTGCGMHVKWHCILQGISMQFHFCILLFCWAFISSHWVNIKWNHRKDINNKKINNITLNIKCFFLSATIFCFYLLFWHFLGIAAMVTNFISNSTYIFSFHFLIEYVYLVQKCIIKKQIQALHQLLFASKRHQPGLKLYILNYIYLLLTVTLR